MKLRWIIGTLMFVTAVCCCGCGQYLVNSFTFYPQKGMQVDPERFNAPIQKIFIKTSDKVLISAFYLPGKETKRAILFLHGNAGNASWRLPGRGGWDGWPRLSATRLIRSTKSVIFAPRC